MLLPKLAPFSRPVFSVVKNECFTIPKRKKVVGQNKEAENKGRCCRTLERGSDETLSFEERTPGSNEWVLTHDADCELESNPD